MAGVLGGITVESELESLLEVVRRWYIRMEAVASASPARLALKKLVGLLLMEVVREDREFTIVDPPRMDRAVLIVEDWLLP